MTEVARPFYRTCVMIAFAAALLASGCSNEAVISGTPPPPTAAQRLPPSR